jgi:hypothetical protein
MRMEAIVPSGSLLKADVMASILGALGIVQVLVEKDLADVTRTWATPVKFDVRSALEAGSAVITISTTNEIFGYVDQGTKPHIIRPRGKALMFGAGFAPKTQPGIIGSSSGASGGAVVFAKYAQHPGTKPRKFTETIARRYQTALTTAVKSAISRITGG